MVEHSVWTGCIGHRGTYPGKLRKTEKKGSNIRSKEGDKLEEYDLRGQKSHSRAGLVRWKTKDKGKLVRNRKKQRH